MKTLFGVDAGDLPEWISTWNKRLLNPSQFDSALPEFLAEVGGMVCADRSFICGINRETGRFNLISEWCAPGIEKIPGLASELTMDDMPYLSSRILKSKAVALKNLDELPAKAKREKELLKNLGIESVFAVPISAGGIAIRCLAVQAEQERTEWDAAAVTLLALVAGLLSTALDQQEVSLQEERLHGFLESAVDFVGIADSDSREIFYLNPAGRELIGLDQDDSLEGITVDLITPESMMKSKAESIYPIVHRDGNWHGETAIRNLKDGEEIPVLQMLVKIPYPDSPTNFGIGSIIRDLRPQKAAEKQIIESERLLRNLIATAPHALYLLNYETGNLEIGEESFAQMIGYTADELRRFPGGVYEPIHPDDMQAVEAQEKALSEADDDRVVPAIFRFRRKDGHWDWIEVHSRVFERDANGKPISEVGMAQVITGRKLAEEQLRRSEERIEVAVRGTHEGLWDSDLTTGKDWWSERLHKMLGLKPGEIETTYDNFVDLLHPADRQRVRSHLEAHLSEGAPYNVEYRIRLKSGQHRWVRGRGEAIKDENNIPVRMAGSVEDISRRRKTELKLYREAEVNRVILHVMSGFAFVLDAEGIIVQWNRAASELTGCEESDLDRKPLCDLLFPRGSRQRGEMLGEIDQIRGSAKFFHGMRKIWRKGGSTRTVEYACSGIYSEDGSLLNIVLVGFDLSPHQRMQREVIRMVEQEQIRIGADLHDGVGQVLTGVSDLCEGLAGRLRDPVSREAAGKIFILVRNAISEIRRMSHGLTATSIEKNGLAGSLRILAESVEYQSRINCSVSIDLLDEVRDVELVTHLFRIAQEAVNNAVKHADCDSIAITLKETEGETVLAIEDNGIGIESKNQSGETGVGLTVIEYRINLMGGTLSIGNRPGGGTRIECRLLVDFDRLDRLKSGKVFLYQSKLKDLKEGETVEPAVKTVDS